jgi:hypothetical protein
VGGGVIREPAGMIAMVHMHGETHRRRGGRNHATAALDMDVAVPVGF